MTASHGKSAVFGLLLIWVLFAAAYAPTSSFQQDNSTFVLLGNVSGPIDSLNVMDGITLNFTAQEAELGLKTVEFFIGQDNSTGITSGTTKSWPFSIELPEDNITVDSAIIEISMKPSAVSITAGSVSIDGANSTAVPLLQSTGPMARLLYRYNATDALANFTRGANSATLRVSVTGPTLYQENTKLILTYRYNRNSGTQLKTVRFFAGSDGTGKPIGSKTTSNFRLNLPEASPSVKSAWIENMASVPATGTATSTYNITIDDNYHLGGLTHANIAGTQDLLILYNATPFYLLGQGWSNSYTLAMWSAQGHQLNLWWAEAVLTYAYNQTATNQTAQRTASYFAGANTTLITAGSRTNFTFNINIPEDAPAVESVWFRVTGVSSAANNFTVNVNGSGAQDFQYNWSTETDGVATMLVNGTGDLAGLVQGNNNLTLGVKNSASTASVLSAEAILTYNYSASSRTQQGSVQYHVYQSFSESNTANLVKTGNFSVRMPATSFNVTSAYLQTDPLISNTGATLTGATTTGYGTWLNGTGSSFSVATTDENLNARTLLNATKVYGSEAIMAGTSSSWGANLVLTQENNFAHSAKFRMTYAHRITSGIEVLHNSTPVSNSSAISSVGATVRFMSDAPVVWNLSIYNWQLGNWTSCNSSLVPANSYNLWSCAVSVGPLDYISADNRIKINISSRNDTLAANLFEDYVNFEVQTVAVPTPSPTAVPVSAGGGAGAGGGGQFQTDGKETLAIRATPAGETARITVLKRASLGVTEILVDAKQDIPDGAEIATERLADRPAEVPLPPVGPEEGKPYAYLGIELSGVGSGSVSRALISFTVEKQWLAEGKYSYVSMMRWLPLENRWAALPTRMTSEDEQYVHYDAESPGLSIFAIVGLSAPLATPTPSRTPTARVTPTIAETPMPSAEPTENATRVNVTEVLGNVTAGVGEKVEELGRQVNPVGLAITIVLLSALLWLAVGSALPVKTMPRHLAAGALVGLLMLWLVAFRPALPIKSLVAGLVISSIAVAYIVLARTGGADGRKPPGGEKFTSMAEEEEEEKRLVKHHHPPRELWKWFT